MFLTTANTLNIPQPLIDRMEGISGYTETEKLNIASKYLLPANKGKRFEKSEIVSDTLLSIIRNYSRDPKVRNLKEKYPNY